MKTVKNKDGCEGYFLYCPYCWQKTIHIPDFSEEEFMKMSFEKYDEWKAKEEKKK